MIKINAQCINTKAEFREFFDADAMERIAVRIARDTEIFADDADHGPERSLLLALAADEGGLPTLRRADGKWLLGIDGAVEVPIASNTPPREGEISRRNARKLLLGEIAGREVVLDADNGETIKAHAGTKKRLPDKHRRKKSPQPPANADGEPLRLVRICNESMLGGAKVDIGGNHTYVVAPGATAFLLKCGEGYVDKLPQKSVSAGYTCDIRYGADGSATVVCKNREDRVTVERQFKADTLQQACADSAGGFVALVDGKIIPYSREVQPDAISDMFIPDDEHVVMIRLAGRQIVALTDKKKVYSNYTVTPDEGRPVLWIGQDAEGSLTYIYEDDYYFPGNADIIDTPARRYIYDKGDTNNA